MLERTWRAKICTELRGCNAMIFSVIGGMHERKDGRHYSQEPGWPDCYVHHTYWQGWVEFKGAKTKLTAKQKYIIEKLNARKQYSAVVCRYSEDGLHLIEDWNGLMVGRFINGLDLLHCLQGLVEGIY